MIVVATASSFAYSRNWVFTQCTSHDPVISGTDYNVLVPLWPSYDLRLERINYDILETPETVDSLVYGSFKYLNHSWNDVLNYKTTGTLIGAMVLENAYISNCLRTYGNRAKYILPGTTLVNEYSSYDKRVSNGLLHYHAVHPICWDPRRRAWYQCDFQYYTLSADDGEWVSNAYGQRVARSARITVQNAEYHRLYQSGDTWMEQSASALYDVAGHVQATANYLPVTGTSKPVELVTWLRGNLFGIDSLYRELHGDPSKPFRIGNNWVLRGHVSLRPWMPNYPLIFDEKGRNPNWHALAGEAYQSLGMADINGVANLTELIGMGEQVLGFVDTLRSIPHKKVKAVASAWLAVHYGFKLTLLDAGELRDVFEKYALKRSSLSKCQAVEHHVSDNNVRYECRYQVFYDEFKFVKDQLGKLMSLSDSYITSENLWDMVPWSFVVDWFISVGDILQSLDNYANLMQKHDVICCGRSIKGKYRPELYELGVDTAYGILDVTYYRRAYSGTLLKPSLIPSVTINPFNHLIEAAALYISIK